jgi:hypothetical protein
MEWFENILVNIGIDFVEFVSLNAFFGEHNDGILVGSKSISYDFLYSCYTIHDWYPNVEDDDSLKTFFEFKKAVLTVVSGGDLKTMFFKNLGEILDDIRVVLDNHNFFFDSMFAVPYKHI